MPPREEDLALGDTKKHAFPEFSFRSGRCPKACSDADSLRLRLETDAPLHLARRRKCGPKSPGVGPTGRDLDENRFGFARLVDADFADAGVVGASSPFRVYQTQTNALGFRFSIEENQRLLCIFAVLHGNQHHAF